MQSDDLGELKTSNDARGDAPELRRRLDQDGYLFFRQLLAPDRLLILRREMLTVMQTGGWLIKGTDPVDGIANPDARSTEGDPEYTDVYHQVYRLQSFHDVAHSREVMDVLERVRGCPMMPQPQKVARLWFPEFTEHTTPIHQDFVHFQGTHDNLTCWSPIGDCPRELGGLAALGRRADALNEVRLHPFSSRRLRKAVCFASPQQATPPLPPRAEPQPLVAPDAALTVAPALRQEDGPKMFGRFQEDTDLGGLYAYTLEEAEDCGITHVNYGTRMLLDFDATEMLAGGEEKVRRPPAQRAATSLLRASVG